MKGVICGITGMFLSMVIFTGGFISGAIFTYDVKMKGRTDDEKD